MQQEMHNPWVTISPVKSNFTGSTGMGAYLDLGSIVLIVIFKCGFPMLGVN
jgi:hypothetical protein